MYKNAKKISPDATKGKGVSAMQPSASGIEGVKLIKGELATSGDLLMNEEKFLKRRPEDVPVDQVGSSHVRAWIRAELNLFNSYSSTNTSQGKMNALEKNIQKHQMRIRRLIPTLTLMAEEKWI